MKGTLVAQEGTLVGTIQPSATLLGVLKPVGVLTGSLSLAVSVVVPDEWDVYEGDYDVIPKVTEQVLPTAEKYLYDDVTVRKIPYYEASNSSGGNTVYIGTEVV